MQALVLLALEEDVYLSKVINLLADIVKDHTVSRNKRC
jgi:uncharacterized protein (UPF0147 family)